MKHRSFSLSAKFMLGLGNILLVVIAVFSFLTYDYLKEMYIKEAYEKTDLVLGHIDATMEYARDVLRPQVFHIVPGNLFIRQVMSSSFMNKGIMERFTKRFPRYIYRRVAIDPMRPADKADAEEVKFIKHFRKVPPAQQQWRGLVTRKGKEYFLHVKGVVMAEPCLLCHGDPAVSPPSITSHYGKVHGRHWKVGEVIGLESIAAPVSEAFRQLRHVALFFFLFGLLGMTALFAVLNYFHYRVAVVPLRRVSAFFREVVNRNRGHDIHLDAQDYEEVSDLAESFNQMMVHLKKSDEERKEMEQRMRQAEKLASIGQLAAGVAHEINNPLSLILGYTKMLQKECTGQGRTHEDLNIVYQNAQICKKIVEDLLNFSRQTKANRISTDMNATLEAVLVSLEDEFHGCGMKVIRDFDPALPPLTADEEKLKRVFTNLLTNARQAMKEGDRVTVRTEYDKEKKGIRVIFTDTGSGIPAAILGKIFEPFLTTKPPGQGTGLGLAVSYGIVKEHRGEISVQSEEGKGTSFSLFFPLTGDAA